MQGTFKGRAEEEKNCKGIKDRPESTAPSHRAGVQRSEERGGALDSAQKPVVTLQRAVLAELQGQHQIAWIEE